MTTPVHITAAVDQLAQILAHADHADLTPTVRDWINTAIRAINSRANDEVRIAEAAALGYEVLARTCTATLPHVQNVLLEHGLANAIARATINTQGAGDAMIVADWLILNTIGRDADDLDEWGRATQGIFWCAVQDGTWPALMTAFVSLWHSSVCTRHAAP